MRVAILTFNAQMGDAVGNQVAEKLSFFLERGADVRVFVESDRRLHPALREHYERLDGTRPEGSGWRYLATADLVVVEYSQHWAGLRLLPLLAGGKPRILFDYHGVTPLQLWDTHNRAGLEDGIRQRGYAWCADVVLAHSRFAASELQEATGFSRERLHVLGHPVDVGLLAPAKPKRDLREELGLGDAAIVLFVGRLAPNKRVPLLVEALDRLRQHSPPIHAVVIGDNSDIYQKEAERCLQRAAELRVNQRLHFLGHVSDDRLIDAYRSANVFVMPSRHEGFCIPVLEAMACGLPVVAARAGALPETVGDAGLTFAPDDADDLARQLGRVLGSTPRAAATALSLLRSRLRVAVVSFRYGTGFVGGAETSLRRIATTLKDAGHEVEVFATCTKSESDWSNYFPEGTQEIDEIPVHRFRLDPHDRAGHHASFRAVVEADGNVSAQAEENYLRHSIHSSQLIERLRLRLEQFDAVLVGPYLFGLTHDVAAEFAEKVVLLPCFHDEPLARLAVWPRTYQAVGGILYHSEEEKQLAEIDLGLNHPGAAVLGTWIESTNIGKSGRGHELVGTGRRYLVYCGRYSQQKNLPLLLEYARRYEEMRSGRFTFVFMGQGEVQIPHEPWARDLGFVDEQRKLDVLAGAAALIQLSHHESLSLVALEAWACGIPVIADKQCQVLSGHLDRCQGGVAIADFQSFAEALDDIWQRPDHWQALGNRGRDYVSMRYGSRAPFLQTILDAIRGLAQPLSTRMRRQGLRRAAERDRSVWRERFGQMIEKLLDAPALPHRLQVEVRPRTAERTVVLGQDTVLVPVRVRNCGTHAVIHEGPAAIGLRASVLDEPGQPMEGATQDTLLPTILLPGQEVPAVMRVPVPAMPGTYRVALQATHLSADIGECGLTVNPGSFPCDDSLTLVVEAKSATLPNGCCEPSLVAVQRALVDAEHRRQLPDDYEDITQGFLAKWKRRIKQKLLGNFKQAYVDVLSRQQSAFNQHLLEAVHELAECYAFLDHAQTAKDRVAAITQNENSIAVIRDLREQLAASQRRYAALEERLARLEAREVNQQQAVDQ